MLRHLFDRVPAVAKDALLAVDERDRAGAAAGVAVAGVERHEPGLRAQPPDVDRAFALRAHHDREFIRRSVDRQRRHVRGHGWCHRHRVPPSRCYVLGWCGHRSPAACVCLHDPLVRASSPGIGVCLDRWGRDGRRRRREPRPPRRSRSLDDSRSLCCAPPCIGSLKRTPRIVAGGRTKRALWFGTFACAAGRGHVTGRLRDGYRRVLITGSAVGRSLPPASSMVTARASRDRSVNAKSPCHLPSGFVSNVPTHVRPRRSANAWQRHDAVYGSRSHPRCGCSPRGGGGAGKCRPLRLPPAGALRDLAGRG